MYRINWLGVIPLLSGSVIAAEEQAIGSSAPAAAISTDDSIEVIRSIPYSRPQQKRLVADIYRPRQRRGSLPGILMVHGGAWFAGDKVQLTLHARYAARRGYAVMAINYRLAPQHKFPAQLEDCQAALRWLGKHADRYEIDPERIAAYGYSAGGHLVSLLGMTAGAQAESDGDNANSPKLRAIVAGGAPCGFDWLPEDSQTLAYWLGGSRRELPEVYRQASPICHVDPDDPPVFFFHGESDQVVPLSSPRRLKELLEEKGIDTSLHIVPGARHYRAFIAEESRRRAVDFLDAILKP